MAGADCDWDQLTASLVISVHHNKSADRAEYHIVAENQESPHSPSSRTARSCFASSPVATSYTADRTTQWLAQISAVYTHWEFARWRYYQRPSIQYDGLWYYRFCDVVTLGRDSAIQEHEAALRWQDLQCSMCFPLTPFFGSFDSRIHKSNSLCLLLSLWSDTSTAFLNTHF